MRRVARLAYGVFGVLAICLSAIALLKPAFVLSDEVYSPLTAHLIREQGAQGIFIGIMALWCFFNFDNRRPVHFALVLFTGLFAGVLWAEYFHARRELLSPLINSVPFLVLLATTPFRVALNQSPPSERSGA